MQMLKEDPKVFFVDIGGSYKKLCENLEGQYIPLGTDLGISINPFDLVDPSQPAPPKNKVLVGPRRNNDQGRSRTKVAET